MRWTTILLPTFLVLATLSLACRATTSLVPQRADSPGYESGHTLQQRASQLVATPVSIPTARGRSPSPAASPQASATAILTPAITPVPTVTPTPTPRPSPSPTATPVPGRQRALVTRIIDGDTIEVEREEPGAGRGEGGLPGEGRLRDRPLRPPSALRVPGRRHLRQRRAGAPGLCPGCHLPARRQTRRPVPSAPAGGPRSSAGPLGELLL